MLPSPDRRVWGLLASMPLQRPQYATWPRGWATDLKDRKIRVNAVSPGVVVTPGYKKGGMTDEQIKGFAAQMATTIPLGRTGEADEIAKAVVFLASDDSSFVNAAELVVDGGMTQV